MKNALFGIFCALVVVALLFGYSSNFDYTYDGKEYGVDFETPTQINSSMIKSSFNSVYSFASKLVAFGESSFNVILGAFSDDVTVDDVDGDIEFMEYFNGLVDSAKEYIKTLGFWTRTFVAPARLDGAIALVRDGTYQFGYASSAYNYNTDIETFKKYCGWSDDDILRIHEFCVAHQRTHTYKNELYDYR